MPVSLDLALILLILLIGALPLGHAFVTQRRYNAGLAGWRACRRREATLRRQLAEREDELAAALLLVDRYVHAGAPALADAPEGPVTGDVAELAPGELAPERSPDLEVELPTLAVTAEAVPGAETDPPSDRELVGAGAQHAQLGLF